MLRRLQTLCFALIACLVMETAASAQTITDLFNTGVNSNGAKLGLGVHDTHYVNTANGSAPYTYADQAWTSNPATNWISPSATGGDGSYYSVTYRTTFTLPANVDLSSVKIVGAWSVDDQGNNILINGNSTGITIVTASPFTYFHPFTLPGGFYKVGQNTLDFLWLNHEAVGGLNVYFTQKSYNLSTATVSGTLRFQSLVAYADNQTVTFEARPVGGGNVVTQTVSVPPSGVFTIGGLAFGRYVLHIKPEKFLAANVNIDATNGNVVGVIATLQPGDGNNDNSVDSTDFGLLIGAYGSDSSVPNSGYIAGADFNGDGVVDSTDFTWLIIDYNLTGAP